MTTTAEKNVPMKEQINLINECRKSGLTDADWCRETALPQVLFTTGSADVGKHPLTFWDLITVIRKLLVLNRILFPLI